MASADHTPATQFNPPAGAYSRRIAVSYPAIAFAFAPFGSSVVARWYLLAALQDGTTVVRWKSQTVDTVLAPGGHTYTDLRIEASWFV